VTGGRGGDFLAPAFHDRLDQVHSSNGLGNRVCNHSFRATGITVYLQNSGTLEKGQQLAAHESPRTTKLYDQIQDDISLDEVERIRL
jgi:site-specific recombinase XerC